MSSGLVADSFAQRTTILSQFFIVSRNFHMDFHMAAQLVPQSVTNNGFLLLIILFVRLGYLIFLFSPVLLLLISIVL